MTNRIKLSVAALALLAGTSGALAADLGGSGVEGPAEYQAPFSWTGLYIGGRFGYGNANHELSL